jgi:hypothetical protein
VALFGSEGPTGPLAFAIPVECWALIVSGSFVLFLGSMWLATRRARNAAPVECLHG